MWYFFPYADDDYFHTIWINDYVNKAWYKRVVPQNIVTACIYDGNVYTADSSGNIYREDFGTTFNGQVIKFMWKSPFLAITNAHHRKMIDEFYFLLDTENDNDFNFSVYKDYDGENLGEFRRNLATYSAVKVRGDGNVSTLSVEVSAENYKVILEVLKKALIENARGFDAKDDRLSGSPNQMNIQSMYSDIDLDANGMETEFQASLEYLLWFVNQDMITKGQGDFTNEDISIIFNRDILINESESIDNCLKSVGILSDETIVSQHPWTIDVKK